MSWAKLVRWFINDLRSRADRVEANGNPNKAAQLRARAQAWEDHPPGLTHAPDTAREPGPADK